MKEHTRTETGLTIGVDLGDKWSRYCVLDEGGDISEEGRITTTARALRKRFSGMARCRMVIEVGTHSPWVQRLLEELNRSPRFWNIVKQWLPSPAMVRCQEMAMRCAENIEPQRVVV